MRKILVSFSVVVAAFLSLASLSSAATPQEQAFLEGYKAAFEAKDATKLQSYLYTKDADPMALEFYKMMMTAEMGGKISKIELRELTADEVKKASATMDAPNGGKSKLPVVPTRKLVIAVASTDPNNTGSSSSETFVANVDGKLLIPVPTPVK